MIYRWKWAQPVPAQAAGEHLAHLEQEHGQLTPRLVLDDARDEDALLHPCFEWRDDVAAELYRERQAGQLLRNLTVQIEQPDKPPRPVRAFVSVTNTANENRAFVGVSRALSDADMREQVLREALQSLQSFRTKYKAFAELGGVIAAIDALNM